MACCFLGGVTRRGGGGLSDFAMGVAMAWFFFGCFYGVMDGGVTTTTTIWQVWLESSLSCVLLMSLANATSLGGCYYFPACGWTTRLNNSEFA